MTNILILAANAEFTRLVESLPGHDVVAVDRKDVERRARPDDIGSLITMDADGIPQIVILGDEIPVGEALSISQRIDGTIAGVDLMLIADADTEIALRAMRVGVREILPPTITEDELKVVLHRVASSIGNRLSPHLATTPPGRVERSRVTIVVSSKGGVGKSTIAVNLAVGLAKMAPMETVLVDLDLQFGDASTLLDLQPTHSIADAFGTSAALDTLILKTFLTVHSAGFYVLCGADSPTVSDHVTSTQVKRLLEQLSGQFRYVIVDTGSGLSEHTLAALEASNDVILVSSMEVASIRSLRKEIDVLTELSLLPSSRHIVLNLADRHSGLTVRDIEGVIGMPVNVVLPRSSEVPIAGNRGEPLMLAKKRGPVAKEMHKLIKRLGDDDPKVGGKFRFGKRSKPADDTA